MTDKFRVKIVGIVFEPKSRKILVGKNFGDKKYTFLDGELNFKEELDKSLKKVAKEKTGYKIHNLGSIYAKNKVKGKKEILELYFLCEATEGKEKKILRNARLKADEVVKNAKAQGEEILRESDQKAKKQSEKILLDAKDAIEQESAKAEKELMENVGKLAIEMLEKSMTNLLDRNQQKSLLKKASDQIKEVKNEKSF